MLRAPSSAKRQAGACARAGGGVTLYSSFTEHANAAAAAAAGRQALVNYLQLIPSRQEITKHALYSIIYTSITAGSWNLRQSDR